MADAKDRKGLGMGLSERRAKEIISGAAFTTEDMADLLGVSLKALLKWLAPADNADHREMPKTAKLLLERIVADEYAKRAGESWLLTVFVAVLPIGGC